MERRLLALDQSSRENGYAIFFDDKLETYGHISLLPEDVGERLVLLRKEVTKLIHKYDINEIAFEDIQMQSSVGNNVQTFKVLAEVFGVILMLCTELKIDYTIVSSNTWKSTLEIKGKKRAEQKRNAQEYVINTYGVKPTQDEADAICIGAHMIHHPGKNTVVFDEGFNWE